MKTLPFDYGKYKNEGYEVVTRDGRKVKQIHLFDTKKLQQPLVAVVDGSINTYYLNGVYTSAHATNIDLFLLAKHVERWVGLLPGGYSTSDAHVDKASLIHRSSPALIAYVKFIFADDTCTNPLTVELIKI